jgi:SAM-dependent methyltransferase
VSNSKVLSHFNNIAKDYDYYKQKNKFYYSNLKSLLCDLIPKSSNVLEFGCGTGDLIAFLNPTSGVGYDPSVEMIKIAKSKQSLPLRGKHKDIRFVTELPQNKFDYVFMSDVIEHLDNPIKEFKNIKNILNKNGNLIITMANPLWEQILMMGEKLGLKMPEGPHNRIRYKDIKSLTKSLELEIIIHDYKLLMPVHIPLLTSLFNNYLEKYLKKFCFIEYFVIKKV